MRRTNPACAVYGRERNAGQRGWSQRKILHLVVVVPIRHTETHVAIASASLVSLFVLGALSAKIGGAPAVNAALRVTFWGALAMALTAAVGSIFNFAV